MLSLLCSYRYISKSIKHTLTVLFKIYYLEVKCSFEKNTIDVKPLLGLNDEKFGVLDSADPLIPQ